jgi:hypothetical protein
MNSYLKTLCLLFIAFAAGYVQVEVVNSQQPISGNPASEKQNRVPFIISCSPEKPAVWPRERINVRVWVSSSDRKSLSYKWNATGGQIHGSGPEVRWDFKGVKPGIYTARVEVGDSGFGVAECSAQVVVKARTGERGGETGWSLLLRGEKEAVGYGLYSYLLFGSPPTKATLERYRKVVETYLWLVPSIVDLENYGIPRSELNINYLPVTEVPPKRSMSIEWVFSHYDYARARVLLRCLAGNYRDGPYIISTIKPLSGISRLTGQYLYQDLSRIPPSIVELWAKEFFNQAAQERFWEERTATKFALKLRTTVAVLAIGFAEVRGALDTLIVWFD